MRWRRENQPGGQNAGSVFTNPPGDSAGRVIDESGCKGLRVGTAVVSEKHANFFIADQGGRADDVRALMSVVRNRVHAAQGLWLEPETRLVGFRPNPQPWTGGRGLTVTETAPDTAAIDPRLRARRIAVRRDEGRRRLRRLTGLGVVAAAVVLALGVTRSPVLDVDRLEVTGAAHTPTDVVQHATGIRRHAPMTDVDLDRARQGVLALPWVRSVSITRDWPATVKVVVAERTAVAVVTAGSAGFALVDGDGRVLETSAAAPAGFMLLANVPTPGPPGTSIDSSASEALEVARVVPASLRPKVSTVVVQTDGVELRLVAGGVVRLGPAIRSRSEAAQRRHGAQRGRYHELVRRRRARRLGPVLDARQAVFVISRPTLKVDESLYLHLTVHRGHP